MGSDDKILTFLFTQIPHWIELSSKTHGTLASEEHHTVETVSSFLLHLIHKIICLLEKYWQQKLRSVIQMSRLLDLCVWSERVALGA